MVAMITEQLAVVVDRWQRRAHAQLKALSATKMRANSCDLVLTTNSWVEAQVAAITAAFCSGRGSLAKKGAWRGKHSPWLPDEAIPILTLTGAIFACRRRLNCYHVFDRLGVRV